MMRLLLIIWLSLPIALVGQIQQAENLTLLGAQRLLNFSYEEAIQALDKAIQLDPNNWVAYEFRAQAHYRLGDKALSLQDLDRAIRLNATNSELYFRRGILHEIFELQEDAKNDYRSAIRLNGGAYEQAEERLSYLSDILPSTKEEGGRVAQGGVLSYAPNHFSSRPYRYDTDRIHIQRREYMKEEQSSQVASTPSYTEDRIVSRTSASPAQTAAVARKATPFHSESFDPYENDDKVFGSPEKTPIYTLTRDNSNMRVASKGPMRTSSRNSYRTEKASPNNNVTIQEVVFHSSFTEVRFQVKGNGKKITLPPDRLRILVRGKSFHPSPYHRQRAREVTVSSSSPAEFSVRFEPLPEKTDYIQVISRGDRPLEKWSYSFRLYPNSQ